jgi:hypothetical protein
MFCAVSLYPIPASGTPQTRRSGCRGNLTEVNHNRDEPRAHPTMSLALLVHSTTTITMISAHLEACRLKANDQTLSPDGNTRILAAMIASE